MSEINKKSVTQSNKEQTQKPRTPKPDGQPLVATTYFAPPDEVILQQALANPQALTQENIPAIQRTVGNRITQQMATRPTQPHVNLNSFEVSAELDEIVNQQRRILLNSSNEEDGAITMDSRPSNMPDEVNKDKPQQDYLITPKTAAPQRKISGHSNTTAQNLLTRELMNLVQQRSFAITPQSGTKPKLTIRRLDEEEEFVEVTIQPKENK